MRLRRIALTIGLLACATTSRAADDETAKPTPPTLLSPPDDADQDHCFLPDAKHGIRLNWQKPPGGADAPADYLEIRRYDADADQWRPWLKQYANPPFTLNVRPRVYDEVFAWRVWAVGREDKHPAQPSDWWLFCTLPKKGD